MPSQTTHASATATVYAGKATATATAEMDINQSSTPRPSSSIEDQINWKIFDQLNGAVSQISNFCFEIKKFCVTTLFAVLGFISKFELSKISETFFIASIIVIFCFWFLDATAYFYQVKIRGRMNDITKKLNPGIEKNSNKLEKIIEPERINLKPLTSLRKAGVNHSMWLYAILIIVTSATWALYTSGYLQ